VFIVRITGNTGKHSVVKMLRPVSTVLYIIHEFPKGENTNNRIRLLVNRIIRINNLSKTNVQLNRT